ncbi:MAG TPA: cobalamin/Fe3+-siderophore ABC transporter ATP-binding protein, partial [Firmicutes bacterium]|nr:cobalamin/Fe3+-siderophore ABC transporter ATP-binding protein [Bacillota bacterium]
KLAVGYGSRIIMDQIDLQALKGQIVGLLGPNGSGKTTLLKTLGGLLAPIKGVVYLCGKDLTCYNSTELSKNLAVLLTERVSAPLTTAFEIVAMGRYPYTDYADRLTPKDTAKVWESLELVNGRGLAEKYFSELSDGEKQKVLLARALTQEPELLILDEPTSFLDLRHRYEIIEVFTRLAHEKKTTIILSLHDIELAARCCDSVFLLKDNQILGYGSPEQLLTGESIRKLYDFQGVNYNELLGVTELQNPQPPTIFVVGGNGSAVKLFRLLSRSHYGICSGIIHENDLDYQVGKSLGIEIVTAKAFEMIDEATFQKAVAKILQIHEVIDAGYPVGMTNHKNLDLIKKALGMGKVVISVRTPEESRKLFGNMADKILYCREFSELLTILSREREAKAIVMNKRNLC